MTIQAAAFANLMNPVYSKIYQDAIKEVDSVFDKYLDVLTSKQQYEKRGGMTGVGLLPVKVQGQDSAELSVYQKTSQTFTHVTYAGHIRITKEAADDDLSGELKKLPMYLAVGTRQTVELVCASFVDLAGTTNQADGVPLLSTAHPLYGNPGATYSNTPAVPVALGVTSLETALSAMRQNVDDYGNPQPLMPTDLMCANSNEFMTTQLFKNLDKAGTPNRDVNAIRRRGINTIINDYLSTQTQWHLLIPAAQRQQLFYWRERINGQMSAAPDTTDDAIFRSRCRLSLGSIDARGWYGSMGA